VTLSHLRRLTFYISLICIFKYALFIPNKILTTFQIGLKVTWNESDHVKSTTIKYTSKDQ